MFVMNARLRCTADEIEPLRVRPPSAALMRLAHRLERERAFGEAWHAALLYGAPPSLVEHLLDFWCEELELDAVQACLDELPLYRTSWEARALCFAHVRSSRSGAVPLLWLHGYSGSVFEVAPLLEALRQRFHVVVPSLPGFFNALGSFGQMIYVNRERGLVIVFTAYMQNDVAKNNLERLVRDYVLPATQ